MENSLLQPGEPLHSMGIGTKPESGEGYEAAVIYAVAKELGYKDSDVKWTRSTFDSAIAPGAKGLGYEHPAFSITEDRKKSCGLLP